MPQIDVQCYNCSTVQREVAQWDIDSMFSDCTECGNDVCQHCGNVGEKIHPECKKEAAEAESEEENDEPQETQTQT